MHFRVLFLVLLSQSAMAQFTYVMDQTIPVVLENKETLSMPWAGGLNENIGTPSGSNLLPMITSDCRF